MIIGCFASVEPFGPMARQFDAIAEMGIRYANLLDPTAPARYGTVETIKALHDVNFSGDTTLEIVGVDTVKLSVERLEKWSQACSV